MNYWYKYLNVELKKNKKLKINSIKYILHNEILREEAIYSQNQSQTSHTFGFKWSKRATYESDHVQRARKNWLNERYLDNEEFKLKKWLFPGANILDTGCGSGNSAIIFFDNYLNKTNYLGVDISSAVDVAKQKFLEKGFPGEFIQGNILNLPFKKPVFDIIFSEGVLHHTDSTEKAVKYLSDFLLPGGRFLFYVYAKKGPIREFTDDLIRNYLKNINNEEAWESLKPLTKLGKILGDLDININIPEEIPYLEIPKGTINLQRLFYWHIFKAYYRPEWDLEELNHCNFDWYRPLNCHRHTPEEIKKWCKESHLDIEHLNIQLSGITVVGKKRKK